MNLSKKYPAKPYLFLVKDITLPSDNPLRFRDNFSEKIKGITMTIEDKIRDEKLQYDINREEAKMSALSSGKTDKHKHLTCKEILPSDKK